MTTVARNTLLEPVRTCGPALLSASDEPHAELLALVWGPRFDREHARQLWAQQPQPQPGVWQTLERAAEQFDGLDSTGQQRLRQLILRHRSRWDNAQALH